MRKKDELKMLQALPLDIKIKKTEKRITEWVEEYGEDGVYVSFSGGKDSTVLLHIARKMFKNIPAVFADTGLEYPAIRNFVFKHSNVIALRPDMQFKEVITKYGYPVIGKEVAEYVWAVRHSKEGSYKQDRLERLMGTNRRKDGELSQYNRPKYKFLLEAPFEISNFCCREMKKKPFNKFSKQVEKKPIMATMAEESKLREGKWLKNGCNSFNSKHPNSAPMSFWKENDVLEYMIIYHDELLEIIKECMREAGYEESQIEEIKHPWADCYGEIIVEDKGQIKGQTNIHEYLSDYRECKFCTTGCKRTGCIFCLFGITQDPERILRVQKQEPKIADYILRGGEFNEKGMWQPSKTGLGFWFVIKWLEVYGNLSIPYDDFEIYQGNYGNEKTEKLLMKEE